MLRCDEEESLRVCMGDIERVLEELDMEGPPERCCEIKDRREEGVLDDAVTWSDNGEEGELLPARWGNAVLEATLRILLGLPALVL
jgi:hypothetical protein